MSCQPGFTNEYHLYGVVIGKCVSISIPSTLCLIAMILSTINVPVSVLNLWKSFHGIKSRRESHGMSVFSNCHEALSQFPMLNVLLNSTCTYSMNAVQFSLIYYLHVTLSTGTTNSLIATIACILVKAFRSRQVFFSLSFLNGFADDFSKLFPISRQYRKSISNVFISVAWGSTVVIGILYIILNQLALDAQERVWIASVALVIEGIVGIPNLIWHLVLAWNLRGVLYEYMAERKEDKRREQIYADFTNMIRATLPLFVIFLVSLVPAMYPPSVNYVVPLKEILNILGSYNFGYSVRKLYIHRDELKSGAPKSSNTGSNPSTPRNGDDNFGPVIPSSFKSVASGTSVAESP